MVKSSTFPSLAYRKKSFEMFVTLWIVAFMPLKMYAFEMQCPTNGHRSLRKIYICHNAPSNYYTCLLDERENVFKESCKIPPTFVRPGQKYVISVLRRNTNCSTKRYQPFKFWSHKLSMCVLDKSSCNEHGQILYNNASSIEDNTCRCDHNQGYAFLQKPKHSCYCLPSTEDCTCYQKQCPKDYTLSSDYQCRSIFAFPFSSECKETQKLRPESNIEPLNQPTGGRHEVLEVSYNIIPTIILCTVVMIMLDITYLLNNRYINNRLKRILKRKPNDSQYQSELPKEKNILVDANCGVRNSTEEESNKKYISETNSRSSSQNVSFPIDCCLYEVMKSEIPATNKLFLERTLEFKEGILILELREMESEEELKNRFLQIFATFNAYKRKKIELPGKRIITDDKLSVIKKRMAIRFENPVIYSFRSTDKKSLTLICKSDESLKEAVRACEKILFKNKLTVIQL